MLVARLDSPARGLRGLGLRQRTNLPRPRSSRPRARRERLADSTGAPPTRRTLPAADTLRITWEGRKSRVRWGSRLSTGCPRGPVDGIFDLDPIAGSRPGSHSPLSTVADAPSEHCTLWRATAPPACRVPPQLARVFSTTVPQPWSTPWRPEARQAPSPPDKEEPRAWPCTAALDRPLDGPPRLARPRSRRPSPSTPFPQTRDSACPRFVASFTSLRRTRMEESFSNSTGSRRPPREGRCPPGDARTAAAPHRRGGGRRSACTRRGPAPLRRGTPLRTTGGRRRRGDGTPELFPGAFVS